MQRTGSDDRAFSVDPFLESRLSEAWEFLSGEAWQFRRFDPVTEASSVVGRTAVLPLTLADRSECACRLVISAEHARRVASHLFGVPAPDVSPHDLEDALREACNVLGSCVAAGLPESLGPLIGIAFIADDGTEAPGDASLPSRAGFRPESHDDPLLDVLPGILPPRAVGATA